MRLEPYTDIYHKQLGQLLLDYFDEVEPNYNDRNIYYSLNMIKELIKDNKTIYLLLDRGSVIGFIVVYINHNYFMTDDRIVIEYMYISPEHRSSLATMYLYTMVGEICKDYNLDVIGVVYTNSSSIHNSYLVGGIECATSFIYPKDKVIEKYNKYIRRIKR